jgi:hypothetical protein
MTSKRYQICIDVDLAVEELSAQQARNGLLSGNRSLARQLMVQRLLLNDPKACDRWLRQCLLWYLQDGVLQERVRSATENLDEASALRSIVGRLSPVDRRPVNDSIRDGSVLEALEGLYDTVSVQRAVLRIAPVDGEEGRASRSGDRRIGNERYDDTADAPRDAGNGSATDAPDIEVAG